MEHNVPTDNWNETNNLLLRSSWYVSTEEGPFVLSWNMFGCCRTDEDICGILSDEPEFYYDLREEIYVFIDSMTDSPSLTEIQRERYRVAEEMAHMNIECIFTTLQGVTTHAVPEEYYFK